MRAAITPIRMQPRGATEAHGQTGAEPDRVHVTVQGVNGATRRTPGSASRPQATSDKPLLKPRWIEVLQLAADGYTVGATAREMGISPQTVRNYRVIVVSLLGADNVTHAVAQGFRRKVVN